MTLATRIDVMAIGQIQRIRKPQSRGAGNHALWEHSSSSAGSIFQYQPTNIAVRRPPSGSAKLFHTVDIKVRKSRSRTGIVVRVETAPLPSADGMASAKAQVVVIATALRRDHPFLSTK